MIAVSNYFEERQAKAVAKAVEKAKHDALKKVKENMALSLIELGKLTLEEIARCSGLTLRQVQMLAKTL